MLQILNPAHAYVGAALDEQGNAVKIVADVFEVICYIIDSQTNPMSNLTVTFARVDPSNNYMKAGPQTQHLITGEELILVLQAEGGITIEVIEESVLRTGIPSAGITPRDLGPYDPPVAMHWATRLIEGIKLKLEELKQLDEERAAAFPPPPGMTPPPVIPNA